MDCERINFIPLDSPKAETISQAVLTWLRASPVASATPQAVAELNPRWIAEMDDWVLLDADTSFGGSQPAIFALYQSWKKHPYVVPVWQGHH